MGDEPQLNPRAEAMSTMPPESHRAVSSTAFEPMFRQRLLDPPMYPGDVANIDRFPVIRQIGQGGMGLVFLCRHPVSGVEVAVKVIGPQLVRDARSVHRFLTEARHMSHLSHPNILKVLDVSDRSDGPYYVMPYMAHGSLADLLAPGKPLDEKTILRVSRGLAGALAYAHEKGIIHRDLKPANVLLDEKGDACLSDFGLVRTVFNDSIVDVRESQCEGTAAYMSPAVATGAAEDTRCDIYSFGAMLHEMLTGHPPYGGRTNKEVLSKILAGPPTPILKQNPAAPPRLVKIAEGAMARELRNRYSSMADVLADLERVNGREVPLGPHGHEHKASNLKWLVAAILLFFAVAGAIVAAHLHTSRSPNTTTIAAPAAVVVSSGPIAPPAVPIATETHGTIPPFPVFDGPTGIPMSSGALVARPATIKGLKSWTIETRAHRGPVSAIAYSPDGKYLATGGEDGTIRLWDAADRKLLRVFVGNDGRINELAWSPNSNFLASAPSGRKGVRIWEASSGKLVKILSDDTWHIAWSRDGHRFATGFDDTIRVWDTATWKQIGADRKGPEGKMWLYSIAWLADSKRIAFGTESHVYILDVESGSVVSLGEKRPDLVKEIAVSPDGKLLALIAHSAIEVWDVASSTLLKVNSNFTPSHIRWSHDSEFLVYVSHSGGCGAWNPTTDARCGGWSGWGFEWGLSCAPNRALAAGISGSGEARLVDYTSSRVLESISPLSQEWNSVKAVATAADGSEIATRTWGRNGVHECRIVTAAGEFKGVLPLDGSEALNTCVAFSTDGTTLASGCYRMPGILLTDLQSSKPSIRTPGALCLTTVAWRPGFPTFAATGQLHREHAIELWNATDRKLIASVEAADVVWALSWSSDGKTLAAGLNSGAVELRDSAGVLLRTLPPSDFPMLVGAIFWSPDGKTLGASCYGYKDGTVIWDLTTGRRIREFHGFDGITLSNDGKLLAGYSSDNAHSPVVCDSDTGEVLHSFPNDTQNWPLNISWCGSDTIATATTGCTLRYSNVKTGETRGVMLTALPGSRVALIGREGRARLSGGAEKSLVYVTQTDDGQETLTPEEFQARYNWHD